jgi:hypothetical protein
MMAMPICASTVIASPLLNNSGITASSKPRTGSTPASGRC